MPATCTSCGAELLPGKRFCHVCGAAATITCTSCGASFAPGFRFCPDCGTPVADAPPAQATPARAPAPKAPPPPDRLTRHIPAELAQKIRDSAGSIAGERKLVTVLFCDVVGSTSIAETMDPEEYHDLLDEYLDLAFREVYRLEGIVNQLAGDGFMALFGAPVAHEDAPHRAISAALAIRDSVARLAKEVFERSGVELKVRIGINTGPVVVGAVGSDLKTDYSAIGDTTNLAARLQSLAAPGGILISDSTQRLVRGFFEVKAIGPLAIKGKAEPITAFEVSSKSEIATPMTIAEARGLTPLVGRDEEIAQLAACWGRIPGGLPQVVAVVGEAGSGKSRMIYEFRQKIAGQPMTLFEARCSSLSQAIPYAPIVAMLKQYFEISSSEPAGGCCKRVADKVREIDPELTTLYPLLCRLLAVGPDGFAGRSADEIKRETFEAVVHLAVALAERAPVLMIIEDLHWIDDSSREMIELAVSKLARARMMILFSHRPDYEPAWRASAALTHLNLRRLTDVQAAEIAAAVAGGRLPADLERAIVARAEGNPFYLEELTRTVVEEGYVVRGDREIRMTRPVSEMRVPNTVHELLAARLDRLGGNAKRVIQVASVLGRQFRRADLARLLRGETIDVDAELEVLERRGVLHRKTVLSDDEFRFGESLTQEVAYEGMLLKERRQLHEKVAQLIESADGERTAERSALLAHHLARSDNRERALAALLVAAADAEKVPSYRTATGFYRQAWELAEPLLDSSRADEALRRKAIEAAIGLSRMGVIYGAVDVRTVEPIALRAEKLAESLANPQAQATLLSLRGTAIANSGRERFAEGLALAESALDVAEGAGLFEHASLVSRGVVWLHMLDGRMEEARVGAKKMSDTLEAAGHRERLTDHWFAANFGRVLFAFYSDRLDESRTIIAEAHDEAGRAGNRTARAGSSGYLAWIEFEAGRTVEALEWAQRALDLALQVGNLPAIRTGAAIGILARKELGEPIPPELAELVEYKLGSPSDLALKSRLSVEAFLAVGEPERARRVVETAERYAGGRFCEMISALAAGELAAHEGASREAEVSFKSALELGRAIGSRSGIATALLGLAERAGVRGDRGTALAALAEARALAEEIGYARLRARIDAATQDAESAVLAGAGA